MKPEMPWEKSDRLASGNAKQYLENFKGRELCVLANREGWGFHLERYVWDAAHFQACDIAGVKNIGYSSAAYDWAGHRDVWRAREEFESACRTQASKGVIAVEVPNAAIERWEEIS